MKHPVWTFGLISAGLVSLPAVLHAEESAPSSVLTSLTATTLSGYVDTSAQWNMGTGNTFVPSYAFGGTSKADGFNLNVAKLTLEKPVSLSDEWGAGYKVDLFAGPDANLFGSSSSGIAVSDFAVRQAYVTLHAPVGNGLDFKVGVWDTIIGYEVTDAPNNPNFTRSYGYTIEPVSHTGVQGTYALTDFLSTTVGVADTLGPVINQRANPPKAESYKTYLGSITFTAPTNWGVLSGSTLSGGVINGFNNSLGGGRGDETSWYVGGTMNTPVSGLKVGASYDYLGVSSQPLRGAGYANAAALYVAYQVTEKLSFYGRGEYATSDLGAAAPGTSAPLLSSRVIATTATVQYDLWKNVLSRLEFRWDHSASGAAVYGDPGALKKNSYILLADIAYKF